MDKTEADDPVGFVWVEVTEIFPPTFDDRSLGWGGNVVPLREEK